MRVSFKHLMVAGWLAAAGCGGEASDNSPSDTSDGVGDAGSTRDASSSDAGRKDASSATSDSSGPGVDTGDDAGGQASRDAGKPSKADAATGTGTRDAGPTATAGETGRMIGMTAEHNAIRAMVQTTPALPDMVWDETVASYAQQWADQQARSQATCDQPSHRSGTELMKVGYGENLAAPGQKSFGGSAPTTGGSTARQAVDAWAAEVKCWTYGTISNPPQYIGTEVCDMTCAVNMGSDGCGHYTQVVWRKSIKLGCGVSTCKTTDGYTRDIWICNYSPAGNFVGMAPY